MLLRSISARIWHDKGHAAGEEAAEVVETRGVLPLLLSRLKGLSGVP